MQSNPGQSHPALVKRHRGIMDHSGVWSGNGSSQASDGFHACMMASGLITQPPVDDHSATWPPGQQPEYPRFDGIFVHSQHHGSIQSYGLPSPAPTAPAASPPEWPRADLSSVNCSWTPISPESPSIAGNRGGGLNSQLNMLPYATVTTTTASFGAGLQAWATEAGLYLDFNQTSSVIPATPSQHYGFRLHPEYNTPWAGQTAVPALPSEPFPQTVFPIPPNSAVPNWNNVPQVQPEATQTTYQPYSPPDPRPNPPSKRPPSQTQQPSSSKRPKPSPAHLTITFPASSSSSPPSKETKPSPPAPPPPKPPSTSKPPSPTSKPTGPTLRTAARRFKRPVASTPKPGESPEHQRARTNHNLVEQQYRHRLHARFEALLGVLPEGLPLDGDGDDDGGRDGVGDGEGSNKGGGKSKRMSKVDVLTRAARVIRFLEGDIEVVRREVEVLRREREAVLGGVQVGGGRNGGLGAR